MIQHPKYRTLTTALYSRSSRHITDDPVFGVKQSLIKPFKWTEDLADSEEVKVEPQKRVDEKGNKSEGFWILEHDFVLVPA